MFILCTVYNSTTVKVGLVQDGVEGQRLFKQLSFRGFNGLSFPTWACWMLTSKVPLHRMLKWSYYGQWNVQENQLVTWCNGPGGLGPEECPKVVVSCCRCGGCGVWTLPRQHAVPGTVGAACSDISSSQSEARDHLLSKAARQNLP